VPPPLVQAEGARPGLHRGAELYTMQLGNAFESSALRRSAEPADPLRRPGRHPRGPLRIVEPAGPQRRGHGQEEQLRAEEWVGEVGRRWCHASVVEANPRRLQDTEPRRVPGRLAAREDVGRQTLDVGARRSLREREGHIEGVLGTEHVRNPPRIGGIARGEALQRVGLTRLEEGTYLCRDVAHAGRGGHRPHLRETPHTRGAARGRGQGAIRRLLT
jgi:hypothetical protein